MMIAGRRRNRRGGNNKLLRTATIAAAALAATSNSVSALQPQRQPIKPTSKVAARTSTSLDYVLNVEAAPETEAKNFHELEKLLQIELSMERQLPIEVGVTEVSPNAATAPPPVLPSKPKANKKQSKKKKLVTTLASKVKAKQKQRKRTKAAGATKTPKTAATSRLSSAAQQLKRRNHGKKTTDLESVCWFRRDGKTNHRLTREEEIILTDRIRALRSAEQVRDQHLQHCHDECVPLTEAEWARECGLASPLVLRKVIRQGQDARSQLLTANMGLVTAIAKRQHSSLKHALEAGNGVGTILTLQDCLQEGQIGLIKAAERFDPSREVRFSTYATWWIRQRILRSISDSSRIIRLPAHVHSKLMKIRKAKQAMQQEIGREPSLPELAHFLEMSVEKLRQYTRSSINVVSLENPLRQTNSGKSDIDTRTLGDTIISDAPTPLEDAQHQSLKRDVQQVLLEALTSTERAVIWARYGLEDGDSKTLEETSRLLGVSRDRVRLVETKALNKLRSPQKNYRLKTYLGGSLNGNAGSTSTLDPKGGKKAKKRSAAPWKKTTASQADDTVDTTNPFASPFDYASMVQSRSKSVQKEINADTMESLKNEERETVSSSSSAPAPDRLWFF